MSPLSSSTGINQELVIEKNACFQIGRWQVEVLSYLGLLTFEEIHYFKVKIQDLEQDESVSEGLLRVGAVDGGLGRELKLRQALQEAKIAMMAGLLGQTVEAVKINLGSPTSHQVSSELVGEALINEVDPTSNPITESNNEDGFDHPIAESNNEDRLDQLSDSEIASYTEVSLADSPEENDYLPEEYHPSKQAIADSTERKLMLLTRFCDESETLKAHLIPSSQSGAAVDLEKSLLLSGQICQFFQYVHQQGWCFIHLLPETIEIDTPVVQFYDLTSAYPVGDLLSTGLEGVFCAPELAGKRPVNELMSSYTIGVLLYQLLYQQPIPVGQTQPGLRPMPLIHQLLKICLSALPEERFSLEQLRDRLLSARKLASVSKIQWQVASRSTVGLSIDRLHNEDNYGICQHQLSNAEPLILAIVADGMGGMAQGEVASEQAVQTVLAAELPSQFDPQGCVSWLESVFQQANEAIAQAVRDGGTTLSLVLGIAQDLMIAHVGDSRIYLLRQDEIYQLSEDHSLVATLVNSGQITIEESLEHPDRNILTKSLGSKPRLSGGYVQTHNSWNQELSTPLENGDIVLLCSDGVWDLISNPELVRIFTHHSLQEAVDQTIDQVLDAGAPDNATLVALKFRVYPQTLEEGENVTFLMEKSRTSIRG